MDPDLTALDATAQAELVRRGELSAAELVEAAIVRIEKLNPALNAVIPAKEDLQTWNALRLHATTVCTEKGFECGKCPLRGECDTGKRIIAEMEAAAKAAKQAARRKKAKKATKKQAKKTTKKKTRKAAATKTRKKPAAKPKRKATKKKPSRPKTSKKRVSKKKPKR